MLMSKLPEEIIKEQAESKKCEKEQILHFHLLLSTERATLSYKEEMKKASKIYDNDQSQ